MKKLFFALVLLGALALFPTVAGAAITTWDGSTNASTSDLLITHPGETEIDLSNVIVPMQSSVELTIDGGANAASILTVTGNLISAGAGVPELEVTGSNALIIKGLALNATGGAGTTGDGGHGIIADGNITLTDVNLTAQGGNSTGTNGNGGDGMRSTNGTITATGRNISATGGDGISAAAGNGHGGYGMRAKNPITLTGVSPLNVTGGNSTLTGTGGNGGDGVHTPSSLIANPLGLSPPSVFSATGGSSDAWNGGCGMSANTMLLTDPRLTATGGDGGVSAGSGLYLEVTNDSTLYSGTVTAKGGEGTSGGTSATAIAPAKFPGVHRIFLDPLPGLTTPPAITLQNGTNSADPANPAYQFINNDPGNWPYFSITPPNAGLSLVASATLPTPNLLPGQQLGNTRYTYTLSRGLSSIPKTGDDFPLWELTALMVLSMVAAAGLLRSGKRQEKKR